MGKFPKTLLAGSALAVAAGLGFVWSGVYAIGADEPHWRPVEAFISFFRDRAIAHHATGITVPANLDDPAVISMGAEHYNAMCTGCHLSPLQQDSEIRPGLYPQPPKLAEHGMHDPAEAFWVIKHGIKLTAMPAWGPTHDDEEIWAMVAFLRKLPTLDASAYRRLTASPGEEGDHDAGASGQADGHAHTH
ncbi:cbb3-type cytochrome c oxidase subunit III [Fluviicoccus keumensis]|uniref:Cbb3-type cytochrome c oxidase subunit III n=1 Tax=Fluviicoccus keumensis TaxID=1435465 RepID=A0A4Q7ZC03_9GAMM|nr:cytochrome c [Fluviicoccus keumensis]RZU48150.1 cbb3-type cytochrome c oxidase subunit III [Fluviicoccus keumensis]